MARAIGARDPVQGSRRVLPFFFAPCSRFPSSGNVLFRPELNLPSADPATGFGVAA
jgi:hypothetical protein